jgi:hypothetical protein
MEAGAAAGPAAPAGGDGEAQQQQQQQGENGAQPTGNEAIAQMAQQLQGLSDGQEQMRQYLEGIGQPAPEEQPQPPPAADLSFLDEQSPNYDPQQAAERLTQVMREQAGVATQQQLEQVLGPLQEQVSDMQRAQEADALVAEFPELGQAETAQAVVNAAGQYAELMGQPELAANTQFIRVTYLAGRAAQLAQEQQGAAGAPGAATLEGAGGASPGGAGQGQQQTADSIRESWARGSDVLGKL